MAEPSALVCVTDLERLVFAPMEQADAEQVAGWHYPGAYSFYDYRDDPEDLAALVDAERRRDIYFSARLPEVGLIGFVELKPPRGTELEVGLGLRPECTGRGLGTAFVRRLCAWAVERAAPERIVFMVAAFNQRAITAYERAGFTRGEVRTWNAYGTPTAFLRMELDTRRGAP